LKSAKLNVKPTLKTIEPHVLEALLIKDLEIHPQSSLMEIYKRLKDVAFIDIQNAVYKLASDGHILPLGSKKYRKYELAKKK
jgi:ATP-dependent DNA helicase RecG